MKRLIFRLLLIGLGSPALAQESYWIKPDSLFKYIQPTAAVQLWGTFTNGAKARLSPDGPLETVENRFNLSARRARLGFRGTPYKNLSYLLMIQYDNLGRDRYSGTRAGVNDGQLNVLDAYVSWKISRESDAVTLTAGYFRPQISRENITGALVVNSFDKSASQAYIRQHVVGKNHGRSMGLNIGGLRKGAGFSINYNAGLFTKNTTGTQTETSGKYWSPVLVGRLALTFGHPEMEKYSLAYTINHFGRRKGLTIGFNRSEQGRTDAYRSNRASGVDILFNYAHLNLDGEWFWLDRNRENTVQHAQTGHLRLGYNLIVHRKVFLEPVLMLSRFTGTTGPSSGTDQEYNAGINWYLNQNKLKVSLHYVWQEGEGKNNFSDGTTFSQGDYAGIGLLMVL